MRENINTFLHKAPMLPITLAFIFGIVFGTYFASLWVLAIATICAAVTAIFKLYIQAAWIAAFGLGAFNISSVLPSENIKNLFHNFQHNLESVAWFVQILAPLHCLDLDAGSS